MHVFYYVVERDHIEQGLLAIEEADAALEHLQPPSATIGDGLRKKKKKKKKSGSTPSALQPRDAASSRKEPSPQPTSSTVPPPCGRRGRCRYARPRRILNVRAKKKKRTGAGRSGSGSPPLRNANCCNRSSAVGEICALGRASCSASASSSQTPLDVCSRSNKLFRWNRRTGAGSR